MDNNSICLVWFEEGSYTQRRFLVQGWKKAQEIVDTFNAREGLDPQVDEAWRWAPVSFDDPETYA